MKSYADRKNKTDKINLKNTKKMADNLILNEAEICDTDIIIVEFPENDSYSFVNDEGEKKS